jgi:hypothetical protein
MSEGGGVEISPEEALKFEEQEAMDSQAEAERSAEVTKENKARVLFTKPTIKYIVSHHSGC